MHICLDESGPFITPTTTHRISAIAALVLPDARRDEILHNFQTLERSWNGPAEAKGSKLNESHVQQVILLLDSYQDVMLDVVAIDMGLQTPTQTTTFKAEQAAKIITAGDASLPAGAPYFQELNEAILELSDQLFLQAFLTILLIERLIQTATVFYALRDPKELAKVRWTVDAKQIGGTRYERLWRTLIFPLVQSRSAQEPFSTLEGADYSYFSRFFVSEADLPEHLRPFSAGRGGLNFKLIMNEEFVLGDSKTDPCLRLIDILASAFTRALNDKLAEHGWRGLGHLLIARSAQTIRLCHLCAAGPSLRVTVPYANVVHQLEAEAKSLWP